MAKASNKKLSIGVGHSNEDVTFIKADQLAPGDVIGAGGKVLPGGTATVVAVDYIAGGESRVLLKHNRTDEQEAIQVQSGDDTTIWRFELPQAEIYLTPQGRNLLPGWLREALTKNDSFALDHHPRHPQVGVVEFDVVPSQRGARSSADPLDGCRGHRLEVSCR